jgi:phenylacetate-CoA ligase
MKDLNPSLKEYPEKSESFWLREGGIRALKVFQETFKRVPGYRLFLHKSKIDPKSVQTMKQFTALPVMSKETYFSKEPLGTRTLDGDLPSMYLLCKSSGSTGKAYYWPRFKDQDMDEPELIQLAYSFFEIEKKSTLVINCLALGSWVAGTMMTSATLEIAKKKDLKLSVITPGANNKEILEIVRDIGDYYDQIVFIAYPPTARNIIVEGIEQGIDWKKYKPKFVVGGEPVSIAWENFILEKVGSKNPSDLMTIFGMAELHVLAFQTPLSTYLRRIFENNPSVTKQIFGEKSLAVLMQFNPLTRWIESQQGELLITALCGQPLVRYNSHDLGGVMTIGSLLEKLKEFGIENPIPELEKSGRKVWRWPFFYSFGRGNAISLMGANIYPSEIESYFHSMDLFNDFKIGVTFDNNQSPIFSVLFELRESKNLGQSEKEQFEKDASRDIMNHLRQVNDDYSDAYREEEKVMTPQVIVYNHREGPFSVKKIKQAHIF